MIYYEIVQEGQEDFILARLKTLYDAQQRVKEMEENDRFLAKYYGWKKMPKYKIIGGLKNENN